MKEPDDGDDELKLYLIDIKSVLQDLFGDEGLNGHVFYGYNEYKDNRGVRVCGDHPLLRFLPTKWAEYIGNNFERVL